MQASEKPIQDVIKKEHTFTIPAYQRPYTWNAEHTIQLLTDIKDAIDNKEVEYFIGSIVTIEKSKNSVYEVVDGQQRLTTINIIFSALVDLIESDAVKAQLRDRLVLVNVYADPPENKPRLQVRSQDAMVFLKVVIEGELISDQSGYSDSQLNFILNKNAAKDFFKKMGVKELKNFSEYLEKHVYLVFISAEKFDSALRLFNVLNARGVPLGNSDLIKSHLYGQVNNLSVFEQAWADIETDIGISDLDYFFGHLRTSIVADKARTTLFTEISNHLKLSKVKPEDFIRQAGEASSLYAKIFANQMEPPSTRKLIMSLRQVTHDDWIPPMLAFFSTGKKSSELTPYKFISLLEKITYQMWICGLYRDNRNQFYYKLIKAIKNPAKQSVSDVFATNWNKDLKPHLAEDVYGRGFAKAVLLRIEMEQQDDSVEKIFNGSITIEHVLPQTMTDKYWTTRFTADEHQNWVHKLGNLTLLSGSKNSSAQNADFEKKKVVFNERNKKVSFDLTKEVCQKQNWSPLILKNRHEELVDEAIKIWKIMT